MPDGRVLQLAMAFGQGTGTMLATAEALVTVQNARYTQQLQNAWSTGDNALKAIEYARAIGAVAAGAAARQGAYVIGAEHVLFALEHFPNSRLDVLDICNC